MSFPAQLLRGLRATVVLWLLTVVVITLPLLGLAHLMAPEAASGNLIRRDGQVVGSLLIGQSFRSGRYLQGRPAGSPHLAPSNPALRARVAAAASAWQQQGIDNPAADLLLDSGSGVDPHISLAAALQQLPRLARERQLPMATLEQLLAKNQEGPSSLQAIEPVVNVLTFNLALDALGGAVPSQDPTTLSRP
ncbi:MAG: potassium-transporting ATPase subunit C [Synechococcaceae cyanobacterium]|jgi:K+-transporting ATPase ATPase C chain